MSFFEHFARILWDFVSSYLMFATPCRANWFNPIFTDFDIFLLLPLSIEMVFPEQALNRISLVITSTVQTLEWVGTWFSLLGFKSWRICFLVCFATPSKFTVVLWFVGAITFDTLRPLDPARESWVTLSPTIFALRDSRIGVGTSNCSDERSNVETSID